MTAITQALNSALLHFLWQGVAVAFLLWVGLFLLRRRSAQARYLACCAALAVLALLPPVTAWMAYERPLPLPAVTMPAPPHTQSIQPVLQPDPSAPSAWIAAIQAWALPVWSMGVLLFSIRLVWGCGQIARMRRRGAAPDEALSTLLAALAKRLGIRQHIRILIATSGESPSVVGWIRPVVLMPSAALLGLSTVQLEAVLTHELAHIRRHDYLVNMLQILVETLLFYHPAVWWVSSRIRDERELCCDDLAVRFCGDAVCYARALTSLERLRVTAPAMAMGSNGGSMLYRIQRLLGGGAADYAPSKLPAILALALGVACFGMNIHWARGQESQAGHPGQLVHLDLRPADSPGITVDLGGAELLHRNRVEYPGVAFERGIEGSMTVELTLDGKGQVSGARILDGPAEFRSAVLHSVLDWHFAQSAANGIYHIRVQFDHAKAEAGSSGESGANTGYAVTRTRGNVAWTAGRAEITSDSQPLQLERSVAETRAAMSEQHSEPGQVYLWTGGTNEAVAYAKRVQEEQAAATTEFLKDELKTAEAAEAGSQSQRVRVNEIRGRLRAAEKAQELANDLPVTLPGRVLSNIEVTGVPEAAKSALLARIGVRAGDTLTAESVEAVSAAVHQFDEHLEVNFGVSQDGQAELHIAAPGPGIFSVRVKR